MKKVKEEDILADIYSEMQLRGYPPSEDTPVYINKDIDPLWAKFSSTQSEIDSVIKKSVANGNLTYATLGGSKYKITLRGYAIARSNQEKQDRSFISKVLSSTKRVWLVLFSVLGIFGAIVAYYFDYGHKILDELNTLGIL